MKIAGHRHCAAREDRDMSAWESGQRAVDTRRVRQALWLWKMAWRDSRGGRKRLLMAIAAISVGMAAFIAITAFDANVREAVNIQALVLVAAQCGPVL